MKFFNKNIKINKKKNPTRVLIMTIIIQMLLQLAFTQGKSFLAVKTDENILNTKINTNDNLKNFSHGGHQAPPGSAEFNEAILVSLICVMSAGLCSGLTVGYLSIEELELQICLQGDNEEKKKMANKVLPIIKQHHLLLSTLLVANALAMETLPIYLHVIFPALYAVLFSTIFVVLFGEIIPQAFCTGPSQLKIATFCVPIIKVLIVIFWVICYPIAKLLDQVLGVDHKILFAKTDLNALMNIHMKEGIFMLDQYKLIKSLFDLRTDPVEKQMVPFSKVYCLDRASKITPELIREIKSHGYSQIPIYDQNKNNIKYIMKTKHLLMCSQQIIGKQIKDRFKTQELLTVKKSFTMLDMLIAFQRTKTTFALIINEVEIQSHNNKQNLSQYYSGVQSQSKNDGQLNDQKIIGVITLKDVFEEILDQQLLDEDLHKDQKIEIEKLKEEKKKVLQEKQKYEKELEDYLNEENEEVQQEIYKKEQELLELKKQLKQQKKKNKKQEELIANQKAKQERQQQQNLQLENEMNEYNSQNNQNYPENSLDEPFIQKRKGSV